MKTATELNAIYQNYIMTTLAKMKETAHLLLDMEIAPKMEQAATEGNFSYRYHVRADADIEIIIAELQKNGYKVSANGRKLNISWL